MERRETGGDDFGCRVSLKIGIEVYDVCALDGLNDEFVDGGGDEVFDAFALHAGFCGQAEDGASMGPADLAGGLFNGGVDFADAGIRIVRKGDVRCLVGPCGHGCTGNDDGGEKGFRDVHWFVS